MRAPHRARSIRTISEFSRTLSNTICLPSAVTSKDCVAAELLKWLSRRDFFVARSSSQKSCAGNGPCAYTSARLFGRNRWRCPPTRSRIAGNAGDQSDRRAAVQGNLEQPRSTIIDAARNDPLAIGRPAYRLLYVNRLRERLEIAAVCG